MRRRRRSSLVSCITPAGVALLTAVLLRPTSATFAQAPLATRTIFGSSAGRALAVRGGGKAAELLSARKLLSVGTGSKGCTALVSRRRGTWGLPWVSRLRGGYVDSTEEEEEEADAGLEDDEFDDDDEGMMDEEAFGEDNFIERLKKEWGKTPIITRTFFQASLGLTALVTVVNKNQWPAVLLLDWESVIYKFQLWRLVTPFLYLGPLGVNSVMTAHFSWTYMNQLEKLHYREPHTFVMLVAFGMISLLLLTLVTGGDVSASYNLGHSFSAFMVMVWSRKFAGTKVNVLDLFDLPTELLPYFFVAQSLMMDGTLPWTDLTGLLIGYAWQTLFLKGLLKAPKPLVNLFRKNAYLRAEYAKAGKEYGQELPFTVDDDDGEDDDVDARIDLSGRDEEVQGADHTEEENDSTKKSVGGMRAKFEAAANLAAKRAAAAAKNLANATNMSSASKSLEDEEGTGPASEDDEEEEEEGSAQERLEGADSGDADDVVDDFVEGGEDVKAEREDLETPREGVEADGELFDEGDELEDLEELDEEMENMLEKIGDELGGYGSEDGVEGDVSGDGESLDDSSLSEDGSLDEATDEEEEY